MKKLGLVAALALSLATATMSGCKGCNNDEQENTLEQITEEQDASSPTTSDDINTSYDAGASADASATKTTPTANNWYTKLTTAINPKDVGSVVCDYILSTQPEKRLIISGRTAQETAETLFDKMASPTKDDFTRTSFVFQMYQLGLQEPSHPLTGRATIVVNYRCEGGELLLK